MEKAVTEAKGKVRLVKVDVDQNQRIAAQMRVQSIPAVFAFVGGQPVDGFLGAQSPAQIKAFIDRLIAMSGGNAGLEEALGLAEEMLGEGAVADAAQTFAAILAEDEGNVAAIAGLARAHLALGEIERAREILALAPAAKAGDAAILAAKAQIELAEASAGAGETAELRAAVERNPDDHQARFDLAMALVGKGDQAGRDRHAARALPAGPGVERGGGQGAALQDFRQPGAEERGGAAGPAPPQLDDLLLRPARGRGMGRKFSLADLPETIPIFPLPGALLLPRARLPLNIFEPRYLAMLEDTLKTPHRLVGMIQPCGGPEGEGAAAAPDRLRRAGDGDAGDRGRAVSHHPLGRLPVPAGRAAGGVRALSRGRRWTGRASSGISGGRRRTRASTGRRSSHVLARFFDTAQLSSDWDSLKEADPELLINSLSILCPFDPEEKQALLGGADAREPARDAGDADGVRAALERRRGGDAVSEPPAAAGGGAGVPADAGVPGLPGDAGAARL